MLEIRVIEPGNKIWDDTIKFAQNCSWRAGLHLAKKMEINDFEENERVLVAMCDDNIVGFCTYANKDELPSEYEFMPFIGFMFVDEMYRGNRISESLINGACELARKQGFVKMYIMSGEIGLYERYGFIKIGDYKTIYGSIDQLFYKDI